MLGRYPDILNMKYNEIFPLNEKKFEDINIFIPNNYQKFSIKYWGKYPPPLLEIKNRKPHEGKMNPNNANELDIKLYPHIYNSLKEWQILIISNKETNLIKKLKKLNINIQIIDEYDWRINNIDNLLKDNNIIVENIDYEFDNNIKDDICLFLSHIKAWKYISNSIEDKNYIILQNNIDITIDFIDIF